MVTAKINPDEYITLDKLIREKGVTPNQVSDVYKLRRGRFNDVRIWSEMDLGTCRIRDLFVTDVNFKPIPELYPIKASFGIADEIPLDFLKEQEKEPKVTEEDEQAKAILEQTNEEKIIQLKDFNKTDPNNWVF